jgi:hypothetical protein
MKNTIYYLIITLFLSLNSFQVCYPDGADPGQINDGPYILNVKHKLLVKWVENNQLKEEYILPGNFAGIKDKFHLLFSYEDLIDNKIQKKDYSQSYDMVDSIGVISDIHGAYNGYIRLLKATGIIDDNLNWKFGRGHLVVLGDVFDRGDMVTEIFWHLFALEKQAENAGGMVHLMLGNHELMVLSGNLAYTNEKYKQVEKITKTAYYDLYSEKSVLGKWVRSKPVAITIDNILFVHGGISPELVRRKMTIQKINQVFDYDIIGMQLKENGQNDEQMFLIQDNGPIWYRGYFSDPNLDENIVDSILKYFNKEHIIVGHTTHKDIRSSFNKKILGIDAGLGIDQPGEMLVYKDGSFYKCYSTGVRIKL